MKVNTKYIFLILTTLKDNYPFKGKQDIVLTA